MGWVADISRSTPYTDDVKVAGASTDGGPDHAGETTTGPSEDTRYDLPAEGYAAADQAPGYGGYGPPAGEYVAADQGPEYGGYGPAGYGAAAGLEHDETAYLPEGEATRHDFASVPFGTVRKRKKRRTHRRSGRWIKVLGTIVAIIVAGGGAVGGWVLTAGQSREESPAEPPVQAQGPPPLTDAQRAASRLKELRKRASRAARDDDSRPKLFAKGTPPVTKKPTPPPPPKPTKAPDTGGPTPVGEAQRIARAMLPDYGWSPSGQFGCLVNLWNKESGWNTHAANPSGAYGIPQALPGSKMASAGSDWRDSARTQIKWGLGYIDDRYGTPCSAWQHSEATGWY